MTWALARYAPGVTQRAVCLSPRPDARHDVFATEHSPHYVPLCTGITSSGSLCAHAAYMIQLPLAHLHAPAMSRAAHGGGLPVVVNTTAKRRLSCVTDKRYLSSYLTLEG